METPENIFRAYDIRGVFGKDLTEEIARKIGLAFGTIIDDEVVVGRDTRVSGPVLRDAITSGLTSTGCDVIDIGVVPSPLTRFYVAYHKKQGGIMITGSHNPAEYNGFYLIGKNGFPLETGTKLMTSTERVKKIFYSGRYKKPEEPGKIKLDNTILDDYNKFILGHLKIEKGLNVVLDTCNGPAGIVAPKLFEAVGCKVKVINEKLDGTFPGHKPEPRPENLTELAKTVKKENADIGIAYDGDADRAAFVDEKGRILEGEIPIIIFCKGILSEKKGSPIVYDIRCSELVSDYVKKFGGVPCVSKAGIFFIINKLVELNAPYGGESSAHHYFGDWYYGFDDAILAGLKMVEFLSKWDMSLSQVADTITLHPKAHDVNFPCPDEKKLEVIARIKKQFEKMGCKIIDIDGVKAVFDDGWVLIRSSNTEPLIRVGAEAKTIKRLDSLLELAKTMVEKEIDSL